MPPLNRVNASPVKIDNAVQTHHDLSTDLDRLIFGPPAIRDGAINQEQMVVGADLSLLQEDYLGEIGELRTQVEAWERGVVRDYTVAGLALTPADVATAPIPDYPAPAPIYGNWILVNGDDTATNGIYDRATRQKIADFDFPVGTQVFVDQTNEVWRVNTEPARNAAGAVTDILLEPWIRFTPYTDQGAIQISGQQIAVASNEARITQTGDRLDFSPETEAELQGLHDTDAALTAENQRQQNAIDVHTRDITGVVQVNNQQQTLLDTHTGDIASVQQVNTQQQTVLDTHTGQITEIQRVDTQQQTAIDGHTQDIADIQRVDAAQTNRLVGLEGTVEDHTGRISVLTSRANTSEARLDGHDTTIVQIQTLDTTQNGQIQDIYTQLATKDTPELRDAAITEDIQQYAADNFPEVAIITGDSRVQAVYNSTLNETIITITGMRLGSQIAGIYDPAGYGAQILKPRRLGGGTTLNFAVKGNVTPAATPDTAWKVCVTTHIPLNFIANNGSTSTSNQITTPTSTPTKLTGTAFGTPGSHLNNPDAMFSAVFDNNVDTFFDYLHNDGAICGLDFGSVKNVKQIRFYPRPELANRMVNGVFQTSNDQNNWQTVHTISNTPASGWNEVSVNVSCRYMRYLAPAGSHGNVSEIEFYG